MLEVLSSGGRMAIADLHKATGIAKPSLVRIIETLRYAGYVGEPDDRRRYLATSKVFGLNGDVFNRKRLAAVAQPIIDTFRRKVGWPVEIGVFENDYMVTLDIGSLTGLRYFSARPGSRFPVFQTAIGKAYCAMLPDAAINAIIERQARKSQPRVATGSAPELWKLIRSIRRKGYSISDRNYFPDIRALGAAVTKKDIPVAAVTIVVLASAMPMKEVEVKYAPQLMDVAGEISKNL